MIQIEGLTKVYPRKTDRALDNVHLTIAQGECFGLLGLNGAGKTTLIKILAGLVLPDSGSATIGGCDVVTQLNHTRQMIGLCGPDPGLYLRLSGEENLRFFSALHKLHPRNANTRINDILEFFGLQHDRKRLVKDYSTGMKTKLQIARALIHDPPVLLLDEPTSGLDYVTSLQVYELIEALHQHRTKTVIYTTHNMREAERLCDRIGIIHHGRLTTTSSVTELKARYPHPNIITVKFRSQSSELQNIIHNIGPVVSILASSSEQTADGVLSVFRLEVSNVQQAVDAVISALALTYGLAGLYIEQPGLEDIFLRETTLRGESI